MNDMTDLYDDSRICMNDMTDLYDDSRICMRVHDLYECWFYGVHLETNFKIYFTDYNSQRRATIHAGFVSENC